jgi:hypothetical protein
MEFTFGIITTGLNNIFVSKIIDSIIKQKIEKYEIIVVGGSNTYDRDIIHIPFDETIKNCWITKKKNIVCEKATYENIVLLHDYVELCDEWYSGFLKYGNDFDICVTQILNNNGVRFRDYVIFPYDIGYPFNTRALIPYTYNPSLKLSKLMYISGAYYIIKKQLALKFPLNEALVWGQGEDVYLCKQLVNNNIIFKCNAYSTVNFLKNKVSNNWETEMTSDDLSYFESLSDVEISILHSKQIDNLKSCILSQININFNLCA